MRPGSFIQAVDDAESTIYVLYRTDREPVTAHWPQPLHELAPEAVRVPGFGSEVEWMPDVGLPVVYHSETWRINERATVLVRKLKARRSDAFLGSPAILKLHGRYLAGESIRKLCFDWREWGYASADSARRNLTWAFHHNGLEVRDRLTALTLALRKRRASETGLEYRRRRTREKVGSRRCAGHKTRRGKPVRICARWAMLDSDFCPSHDPRKAEERARHLAELRSARRREKS